MGITGLIVSKGPETVMGEDSKTNQTGQTNPSGYSLQVNSEYEEINRSLMAILENISSGGVHKRNNDEVNKKLNLLESMIRIIEKKEGENKNKFILKKLLLISQMQMNNLAQKVVSIGKEKEKFEAPHLPSITQYKPEGSSNIFSPLIDINTSSEKDNKRFSNAFEKGFEKGLEKGQEETMYYNTFHNDKYDNYGQIANIDNNYLNRR